MAPAGIALWGAFAAPRARIRLPLTGVLVVKAVVLGGGASGLYRVGHPGAAVSGGVLAFKTLVLGGGAVALCSMGHTVAGIVLGPEMVVNTRLAETFRRRPPATG
ncbi:YrdB family protein [Streptomyces sp. ITFR-6]|uniref:YrdB family protein n=1 Tax=Streptomyces sp. ITFR-6 TaxID=3075197 RepID=UPI0037DA5FD8